ncbi:2-C-methyl-D-erythritol 2,4-cyclodiphosphate synthase [bacterium]|nr:2-C-methyl-D-erythritol 2,4-cyclodiphosphate synthase [bacterium]
MRIGFGFDAHRKTPGRALILGGVEIPSPWGLEAHSDGDVITHAIMDALLGAANLKDKGVHFPPEDPQYKDIYSIQLLEKVGELLQENHLDIGNLDVTVVCQEPKLAPHITPMKKILAAALRISESQISIKATTTERMGFAGRGEGIAAFAVTLLGISPAA